MSHTQLEYFYWDNMDDIASMMHECKEPNNYISYSELIELFKTGNITLSFKNINRLQSMLLCELNLSYTQQSQRYVNNTEISILPNTPDELLDNLEEFMSLSRKIYNKITKLKPTSKNKKGRLKRSDFVYGINYEDARCILPLYSSTNIVISFSSDKLIDLFKLFNRYDIIFRDLKDSILQLIPSSIRLYLSSTTHFDNSAFKNKANKNYFYSLVKNTSNINRVVPVNLKPELQHAVIGALASQNSDSPCHVFDTQYTGDVDKQIEFINRILEYGHTSVIEHIRYSHAMMCSLSTYHQVIRHRIQNIQKESIDWLLNRLYKESIEAGKDYTDSNDIYMLKFPLNEDMYTIPKSIMESDNDVKNIVLDFISEYHNALMTLKTRYDNQFIAQFLLNCTNIKFVVSSNLRNDINIFRDRLCFTAQDEILNLYLDKFKLLRKDIPYSILSKGLPPCVLEQYCKEGKLNCGQMKFVQKFYSETNLNKKGDK